VAEFTITAGRGSAEEAQGVPSVFAARLFAAQAGEDSRPSLVPIALGSLLLSAAGLKGYELFVLPLPGTSLLSSRAFRIGAMEAECLLGLWLLSGLGAGGVRWAALAAFNVFFTVSLSKALAGEQSCGCFGRVSMDPRWTAALDLVAILALSRWRPVQPERRRVGSRWPLRVAVLVLPFVLVAIPGGILLAVSGPVILDGDATIDASDSAVVLAPEQWVGRRCPLLPYIDIGNELSRGRWLIVLYHHNCPRCQEVLLAYEERALAAASDPAAPRIAFVAVPPYGPPREQFAPHSSCRHGRLSASKKWFVSTPAILLLHDGTAQPETAQSWGTPEQGNRLTMRRLGMPYEAK
jgi:hypothetical protein